SGETCFKSVSINSCRGVDWTEETQPACRNTASTHSSTGWESQGATERALERDLLQQERSRTSNPRCSASFVASPSITALVRQKNNGAPDSLKILLQPRLHLRCLAGGWWVSLLLLLLLLDCGGVG